MSGLKPVFMICECTFLPYVRFFVWGHLWRRHLYMAEELKRFLILLNIAAHHGVILSQSMSLHHQQCNTVGTPTTTSDGSHSPVNKYQDVKLMKTQFWGTKLVFNGVDGDSEQEGIILQFLVCPYIKHPFSLGYRHHATRVLVKETTHKP
jgi:hypothetical protein